MRIGVLGTGMVGQHLAARLAELGHEVTIGTRDPTQGKASATPVRVVAFAQSAGAAELVINATAGSASLAALELAGAANLRGKVLLDLANPLDFSTGQLRLTVVNTDSLGESIQRAYPDARVVKALNMVNLDVMTHPDRLAEETSTFVAGDDGEAKASVADLLRSFGWRSIVDLGGISAARGMEMYLPLWLSLMSAQGTPQFNIKIVHG